MDNRTETWLPILLHSGRFSGTRRCKLHQHDGAELVLIEKGHCEIEIGKLKIKGEAGTLYVLPGKVKHAQCNLDLVSTLYITFQHDAPFDESPRTLEADKCISRWMEDLCSMDETIHTGLDQISGGILYSLLQRINQLENTAQKRHNLHPALERAINYIENHINRPLPLDLIARHAGISKSHLSALFREHLNHSPTAYILDLKMTMAKRLLRNLYAELSIKEISASCGFNDPNYFCRIFRKHYQESPVHYRQRVIKA
ncbi:MAG: AraC family transcriptional regulator [Chloroflexota bacterium]